MAIFPGRELLSLEDWYLMLENNDCIEIFSHFFRCVEG